MGLLDAFNDPVNAGLLTGLAASGPSSKPMSLGQIMQQGYGGFQQAQEAQQQRAAKDQEMRLNKMKLAQLLQTQEGEAEFVSKLPPDFQAAWKAGAKTQVLEQIFKDRAPKVGQVSPDKYTPESLARYQQTNNFADLKPSGMSREDELRLQSQLRQDDRGFQAQLARQNQPQQPPYFSPANDAIKGQGTFDHRTGKYSFPDGSPLINPKNSPSLQGQIAGAKVAGEASAKRDVNMNGIGDVISRADSILKGKAGSKPTSSGVGTALDAVAGVVGVSPKGAAEASELKALGGALVAKMPRMEGPQSNLDVQLYREMAGDIANPMLPLERRIKALETVKGLYSKYDKSAGNGVDALLEKYK